MSFFYHILKPVLLIVLILLISGCSRIKSYFPDKEKEYVNSVEIAPLIVPPDLTLPKSKSSLAETEALAGINESPANNDSDIKPKEDLPPTQSKTDKKVKPKPKELDKVRLVNFAGGPTRLQIDEPFVLSWRIVGKSLTRKSLEIIDRNINDGLFLIQYDPNETNIEDGSLWDEFTFFFGDDKSNEQEYQIRLIEDKGKTEVLVLDQEGVPLSQGVGLNLLNLMHDTIKANFAEQQKK